MTALPPPSQPPPTDDPFLPDFPDTPEVNALYKEIGREALFDLLSECWERQVPFDLRTAWLSRHELLEGRFSGLDLSRVIATAYPFRHQQGRARLERMSFVGATLDQADFTGCILNVSLFDEALCSRATFSSAMMEKCRFLYADLTGATLTHAHASYSDFRGARAKGLVAQGAHLCHADFRGANLREANLWGADLSFADLTGADLTGAILWGAIIEHTIFTNTRLDGTGLVRRGEEYGARTSFYIVWEPSPFQWVYAPPRPTRIINSPFNAEFLTPPPELEFPVRRGQGAEEEPATDPSGNEMSEEELQAAYEEYQRWWQEEYGSKGEPPWTKRESSQDRNHPHPSRPQRKKRKQERVICTCPTSQRTTRERRMLWKV